MDADRIEQIAGGFWIARHDTHISSWQRDTQRLDHDSFLIPFCCQFIPEGGFVLDGGAFNGDHSVAYSRTVGPDGLIIAVEPGELAFTMLSHNVKLFDYRNVVIANLALSNHADLVSHVEEATGNLGMSHAVAGESIKSITIDQLVERDYAKTLDFIKLDIEGWELKALRGARRVLEFDRPVIVLEVNDEALRLQDSSYEGIRALLKSYDYAFRVIQPECREAASPQFDILCVPDDKKDLLAF